MASSAPQGAPRRRSVCKLYYFLQNLLISFLPFIALDRTTSDDLLFPPVLHHFGSKLLSGVRTANDSRTNSWCVFHSFIHSGQKSRSSPCLHNIQSRQTNRQQTRSIHVKSAMCCFLILRVGSTVSLASAEMTLNNRNLQNKLEPCKLRNKQNEK